MPPISGTAESLKTLPEPMVTPPAVAAPDHADDGLVPNHPGEYAPAGEPGACRGSS